MSNTLEESLERRLHVLACQILELDDEDHEDDDAARPLEEALKSLILSEAHRIAEQIIGEDEDLNVPAETYGKEDQSLGDNPCPNPNLQYVVRRATRNIFRQEQRLRLSKITGSKEQ